MKWDDMSTGEDSVRVVTTAEGMTTITLSRPSRRNAVDPATARKLYQAFIAFEEDATQKVAVFHGDNGTFCAGYDLHTLSSSSGKDSKDPIDDPAQRFEGRNQGPMGPSRLRIKKPVIAAVAGFAVAGGLELSLLGDMRVVEEDAVFGVFCRRWGVPLIDGGTVRLQRVVGMGRALDMILTGRGVTAHEAHAMGLANRVVPRGKSLEEATKIARGLLQFPQACMNADRDSVYYSAYDAQTFADAMTFEFDGGSKVITTESIQGASKFSKGAGRHGGFSL